MAIANGLEVTLAVLRRHPTERRYLGKDMSLRAMNENDWMLLKQVRLAALLDTLTAFGVSYTTSAELNAPPWGVFNGVRTLTNVRGR